MNITLAVYKKELIDALRDRRTLLMVLLSSVLIGPVILAVLSVLVSSLEARAEQRTVLVTGGENAPALINYLERQTYTIKSPPADFEAQLRSGALKDPVIVIPKNFQEKISNGESASIELVSDSANQQAEGATGRIERLLNGFNREQAALVLITRGVSPAVMSTMKVEEKDLASVQSRATRLTGMLPFFVLMAVRYGALNAALDTSAGERERGSIEPLLMNPAPRMSLVLGKWLAVATVGMMIAVLSALSFLPAQLIIRNETLQAMFAYGPKEAAAFIITLVPFAAAISGVLMAVAMRCKSFKEAQANNTVVILAVSMMPLVTLFGQSSEAKWQLLSPGLGQNLVMSRVLKGESLGMAEVLLPMLSSALIAGACVWLITSMLKRARFLG